MELIRYSGWDGTQQVFPLDNLLHVEGYVGVRMDIFRKVGFLIDDSHLLGDFLGVVRANQGAVAVL